ncbi:Lectin-related protein [Spatholobus suberectus]|nr:Lectin-related protein [Spatholobus suberectus]
MYLFLLQVNAQLRPILSFTMDRFVANQPDLIFQGDAQVSSAGVLEVTKKENDVPVRSSIGRVLYSSPLQIWDSKTNRALSFATEFTFVVKSPTNQTADGMAFFIAPPDFQIPLGSGGVLLGLFSDCDKFNDTSSQGTVDVEFNTCFNEEWDPRDLHHIGINVNSIQSGLHIAPWPMKNGEIVNAVVFYMADYHALAVVLFDANGQQTFGLGRFINLMDVLPEWVRFGFSATVGVSLDHLESHNLLSWSFHAFRSIGNMDETTLRDAMM